MENFFMDAAQHAPFAWILVALIGLTVGSFLNVVIHRLPRHASIAVPGSRCPACGHPLAILDNIPVLSWIFLRGRCRYCHTAISYRYPAVETITALLSLLTLHVIGWHPRLFSALIFLWSLLALSLIDLETSLLPDRITKPGMVIGILINTSPWWAPITGVPDIASFALTKPISALIGLPIGYVFLRGLNEIYRHEYKLELMRHDDMKLLAMIGAWLGWHDMFTALYLAAISGGLVAVGLLATGKNPNTVIPIGPYLALGGAAMALWPAQILSVTLWTTTTVVGI